MGHHYLNAVHPLKVALERRRVFAVGLRLDRGQRRRRISDRRRHRIGDGDRNEIGTKFGSGIEWRIGSDLGVHPLNVALKFEWRSSTGSGLVIEESTTTIMWLRCL